MLAGAAAPDDGRTGGVKASARAFFEASVISLDSEICVSEASQIYKPCFYVCLFCEAVHLRQRRFQLDVN